MDTTAKPGPTWLSDWEAQTLPASPRLGLSYYTFSPSSSRRTTSLDPRVCTALCLAVKSLLLSTQFLASVFLFLIFNSIFLWSYSGFSFSFPKLLLGHLSYPPKKRETCILRLEKSQCIKEGPAQPENLKNKIKKTPKQNNHWSWSLLAGLPHGERPTQIHLEPNFLLKKMTKCGSSVVNKIAAEMRLSHLSYPGLSFTNQLWETFQNQRAAAKKYEMLRLLEAISD